MAHCNRRRHRSLAGTVGSNVAIDRHLTGMPIQVARSLLHPSIPYVLAQYTRLISCHQGRTVWTVSVWLAEQERKLDRNVGERGSSLVGDEDSASPLRCRVRQMGRGVSMRGNELRDRAELRGRVQVFDRLVVPISGSASGCARGGAPSSTTLACLLHASSPWRAGFRARGPAFARLA